MAIKGSEMIKEIVIEWNYVPENYFEEGMIVVVNGHKILVDVGHAEIRLDPKYFDEVADLIALFTANLQSRFLAVQVLTHESFTLLSPSRYDLREDGTKNHYLQAKSLEVQPSVGVADITVRDADGNILADSKRERIDKKRWFAETAARFRMQDKTLNKMLQSYYSSVADPDDELVHLYEIRDAIKKRFGSESKARKILNITKQEWSDFGQLTNKEPLKEGRHRGQHLDPLRKAKPDELAQVRRIAKKIIENYMRYLEGYGS